MAKGLSLLDMDALLRSAGAQRVGEDASRKLCEILEDSAEEIVSRARVYAFHAGRSEITREDVRLAAEF
jgi:DNA-binding protein